MNDTGSGRAGRKKTALIFIIFCLHRVIIRSRIKCPPQLSCPCCPFYIYHIVIIFSLVVVELSLAIVHIDNDDLLYWRERITRVFSMLLWQGISFNSNNNNTSHTNEK